MIMKIPIRFDDKIAITYHDGSVEYSSIFPTDRGLISCTFQKSNGYDSDDKRVTNLVGYNEIGLIKRCPKCRNDKNVTDFGYSGRTTDKDRDQSHCTNCRSS